MYNFLKVSLFSKYTCTQFIFYTKYKSMKIVYIVKSPPLYQEGFCFGQNLGTVP